MSLLYQPQKIFIIIILTGFITLFALSHFALYPLYDASLTPNDAATQCLKFTNYFNKTNLLIYVLLIFSANIIYRNTQKGIYLFYGWIYFSLFTLFSYIYMTGEHFRFIKKAGLWSGGFEVGFIIGFMLILIAATAAFINYTVLKRMANK
jgi:hypothetical protein